MRQEADAIKDGIAQAELEAQARPHGRPVAREATEPPVRAEDPEFAAQLEQAVAVEHRPVETAYLVGQAQGAMYAEPDVVFEALNNVLDHSPAALPTLLERYAEVDPDSANDYASQLDGYLAAKQSELEAQQQAVRAAADEARIAKVNAEREEAVRDLAESASPRQLAEVVGYMDALEQHEPELYAALPPRAAAELLWRSALEGRRAVSEATLKTEILAAKTTDLSSGLTIDGRRVDVAPAPELRVRERNLTAMTPAEQVQALKANVISSGVSDGYRAFAHATQTQLPDKRRVT